LGGYKVAGKGVYFERIINLPAHKKITISFTVYAIDSWDNELFSVKADGTEIVS